jgi:hypothetical protein
MLRILIILAFSCFSPNLFAQIDVPFKWAMEKFSKLGLNKTYQIDNYLKPTSLQSDLNGDKEIDFVLAVLEITSKKKGMIIFHANSDNYFVIGAGKKFNEIGENFSWANNWAIYKKSSARQTTFDKETGDILGGTKIKLVHPGIRIVDEGGTGSIIYWNGQKYISIHQGT